MAAAPLSAYGAAVGKPPTNAYFVASNGAVYSYGRTADGTWQAAAPVGAKATAPPGAPIASARLSDGSPVAFFVGDDGAIWGGCGSLWRMTPVKLLRPGTPLTVAATPTVVMLLFSNDQGQTSGIHIEAEIHHPCDVSRDVPPPPDPESPPGAWHVPNGTIAATGLPDGEIGVFAVDVTGAVHATWRSPSGRWTDKTLTPSGTSLPGGGIASTLSPTDGSLTLFYSNHSGQVILAQVTEGAGLRADPRPSPWTGAKISDGAALAGVSSTLGNDIAYIAAGGTAIDLQTDTANQWMNAVTLSPPGFAKDGRPVAVTASPDEVDVYCGTATDVPGHFSIPPHTGGDITWQAAGAPGMVPLPGWITGS